MDGKQYYSMASWAKLFLSFCKFPMTLIWTTSVGLSASFYLQTLCRYMLRFIIEIFLSNMVMYSFHILVFIVRFLCSLSYVFRLLSSYMLYKLIFLSVAGENTVKTQTPAQCHLCSSAENSGKPLKLCAHLFNPEVQNEIWTSVLTITRDKGGFHTV